MDTVTRPSSPHSRMVLAALILLGLTGCSDFQRSESPVHIATELVAINGRAEHPSGGTITVEVDGEPVTIVDGAWSHAVPMEGDHATITIAMYRDGVLMDLREIALDRER